QAATKGRDREVEATEVVPVVQADVRVVEVAPRAAVLRERRRKRVSRGLRGIDYALVHVAVRIGQRRAWTPEVFLDCEPGLHKLLGELLIADLREVRVRAGVRRDLPADRGKIAEFRPVEA